ncbi:MAG: SUMF1/EgtB/PvdO family nonheme iron enzyme [Cyanobacteria bacterium P01_G01_bin.54]
MANWAWIVGINQYDNFQNLKYAVADAAAMRDYCQRAGFEKVFYFVDDAPQFTAADDSRREASPTCGKLFSFLNDFFEQPLLGDGDNFWFFFSGHGMHHDGHDYLLPSDGNPRDLPRTGILVSELTAQLKQVGADNIILLLDACRNRGARSRAGGGIGDEVHQGVITVYSCAPHEESWEIDPVQHGSFTQAVLETLDTPNCATVEKFCKQIAYRVLQLNQQYGKPEQHPLASVEPNTKNYLILFPGAATAHDLSRMREAARDAQMDEDWLEAKRLWWRVLSIDPSDSRARERYEEVVVALRTGQRVKSARPKSKKKTAKTARPKSGRTPTAGFSLPKISRRDILYYGGAASLALSIAFARWVDGIRRSSKTSVEPEPETPQPQLSPSPAPEPTPAAPQTSSMDSSQDSQTFDLGNGVTLEMVAIPGGTFMMGAPESEVGSDDERPQHGVNVLAFTMGKYAVTQAQYEAMMGENPANFKGSSRPVEKVSWNKAQEFCQKLSERTGRKFRLPSEAEWEYACRAETTTLFYFGETINTDQVNYDGRYPYGNAPQGEYREQTTDVGSFSPNTFGLYDMHGNVWEWCEDVWHDSYEGAPNDGSAWLEGSENDNHSRVLRGGSWVNSARVCRSASRSYYSPAFIVSDVGFRVCVA